MNTAVISPAYGRDYIRAVDALADFNKDMDFILENANSRWCGKPCNRSDLTGTYDRAEIRFNGKRDVVYVELN